MHFFINNRLFNVLVCFCGRIQYLWGTHHSATEWFALEKSLFGLPFVRIKITATDTSQLIFVRELNPKRSG